MPGYSCHTLSHRWQLNRHQSVAEHAKSCGIKTNARGGVLRPKCEIGNFVTIISSREVEIFVVIQVSSHKLINIVLYGVNIYSEHRFMLNLLGYIYFMRLCLVNPCNTS